MNASGSCYTIIEAALSWDAILLIALFIGARFLVSRIRIFYLMYVIHPESIERMEERDEAR